MNEHDLNLDRMREAVLKLEVTQYAKAEAQLAKEELRQDIREQIRIEMLSLRSEAREDRRRLLGYAILAFTILIGGDIWTVWSSVNRLQGEVQKALQIEVEKNRQTAAAVLATETQKMHDQIRERLNHEFETPRLHQMIGEEARRYTANEAQAYINTQVEAVLKPFREQVSQELARSEHTTQQLQQNEQRLTKAIEESEKLTKSLSQQVSLLTRRNDIYGLGAAAIDEGDRASLGVLTVISEDQAETKVIRETAEAEMLKVKAFWVGIDKIRASEFHWTGIDGKPKAEAELTACDLLHELRNSKFWQVRAKAAQLLANQKKVGVPEGLLRVIQSDSQLHTVRDAVKSFEQITGYRSGDVFGLPFIEIWWKDHAEETTKKLQKLDCEVR